MQVHAVSLVQYERVDQFGKMLSAKMLAASSTLDIVYTHNN